MIITVGFISLIGGVVGLSIGLFAGWISGPVMPNAIVGFVAGIIAIWTCNSWPGWFGNSIPSWAASVIVLFCCVMLGGTTGAFTGWAVRGVRLGAIFGVVLIIMPLIAQRLPIKIQ